MANVKKPAGSVAKKAAEPTSVKQEEVVATPVQIVEKKEDKLSPDLLVPCVSLVKVGDLIYQSSRQIGYRVVWHSFMETQNIELAELVTMKSTNLDFFSENWIVIPDYFEKKEQVMKMLRIEQYYQSTPDPFTLNELLNSDAETMIERINKMSPSVRDSIKGYAREAIAAGKVDSYKQIKALETALNCSLT